MGIENDICVKHQQDTNPQTHDPAIAQRVDQLAIELLRGDANFTQDWNAYKTELTKGSPNAPANAPDVPNAANRRTDAAIDLHCDAPLEARLYRADPKTLQLDIDNWRSFVNASVILLSSGKWTAQQAQDELNKVRPEDRQIAAADFSRDCLLMRVPYAATAASDGTITVNSTTTTTGMR